MESARTCGRFRTPTYDVANTALSIGQDGFIYASDTGSTTGGLWYDSNGRATGGHTLVAIITEYGGVETDNVLTEATFPEFSGTTN